MSNLQWLCLYLYKKVYANIKLFVNLFRKLKFLKRKIYDNTFHVLTKQNAENKNSVFMAQIPQNRPTSNKNSQQTFIKHSLKRIQQTNLGKHVKVFYTKQHLLCKDRH